MKWIADRVRHGELLSGAWLNLGSSLTAEIAGLAGFDWVCIDLEHGAGDFSELVHQLQALESTPSAPVVRIAANDAPRFKRVLDLGPSGVMVPYVNSRDEARRAAAAMQYPPAGIRGVAKMNRAARFGSGFDEYFALANDNLALLLQIETKEAISHAEEIAAVDGVTALFVGPLDLSVSLGIPQQYSHPEFLRALNHVVAVCRNTGRAAGILVPSAAEIPRFAELGFTLIAASSDGSILQQGMAALARAFGECKR